MQAFKSPVVKPSLGSKLRPTTLSVVLLALLGVATIPAQAIQLYVDTQTQQVFTSPGINRVKLSEFEEVNEAVGKVPPEELKTLETRLRQKKKKEELKATEELTTALTPKPNWTDRISLRGYAQLRYNQPISGDNVNLASPADRFISDNNSFGIRRARIILSGDITDHLYIYIQPEFNSGPDTGDSQGGKLQIRDFYSDISFDDKKEYRIRAGISKVPYGFEILQSSQNRLSMDRADAVNIASRDERDLGAMFYWAPAHIRDRFRDLVRSGLKGSGDYGVFGLGVYNGQGLNRAERNENLHTVARLSYPFKFDNGQFFEAGISAFTGKYVPSSSQISVGGVNVTPTFNSKGIRDERMGVHAVLYPQPFGLQGEWNWGNSPQLSADRKQIASTSLNGGYIQAMYKLDNSFGSWIPYIKWQRYDGSEKFSTNAPRSHLRETEVGVEWLPMPELELTVAYANMDRTNINTFVPLLNDYRQVKADMLRAQLQWNF
ncbi:MAG: Phosphate-selective porin [Candidatus Nitrotoga sp. SPKER]|nr:MAG: Phosphate-selective porin [Candidatus Nitrotoga sp. SPKER]